jgi:hypothetical protein
MQGTNDGDFYTDVCRNESAPTISFVLKFSSPDLSDTLRNG